MSLIMIFVGMIIGQYFGYAFLGATFAMLLSILILWWLMDQHSDTIYAAKD